jgi:predicted nuclease of predicted toxin-antitoxin system
MPRILLDQNIPAPLARLLAGHEVVHTAELGWGHLSNGDLLAAAQRSAFEILVTADQNMLHQQNPAQRTISVLVLETNHWPTLRTHHRSILQALDDIEAAGYRLVTFERPWRGGRD